MPKVPAKCGLLQVCLLSLYTKVQQSVSEIGESLWRILEIFPFCRDASRRRRAISTAWCGTQSRSGNVPSKQIADRHKRPPILLHEVLGCCIIVRANRTPDEYHFTLLAGSCLLHSTLSDISSRYDVV